MALAEDRLESSNNTFVGFESESDSKKKLSNLKKYQDEVLVDQQQTLDEPSHTRSKGPVQDLPNVQEKTLERKYKF